MEQNAKIPRLKMLDGIRGIAILLVVLTHVNPTFILSSLPLFIKPYVALVFTSGVTGVSLLFILSGFFMGYIYPNPVSTLHFLQKRYTRIFPLFLTMCVFMLLIRNLPNLAWYLQISYILILALITNIFWVFIIKRVIQSAKFSKGIFISFLIIQALVACFYAIWIMRHTPLYFNQQLPVYIREGTIGLVNATLTLGLGNYVPMLDGVYWSLASEVLFYILYPIVAVPLIALTLTKGKFTKLLFIATFIPLFVGIYLISHRLAVLSIFQFELFFYFVTGISLAYFYRLHTTKFEKVTSFFNGKFSFITLLLFFILVFSKQFIINYTSDTLLPWMHILWAIPLTFIIALAINHKSTLSKFLSSKVLVFLGTISYSLYLSHTAIIHLVEKNSTVTSIFLNVVQIIIILLVSVVISFVLYQLLEKPYFTKSKSNEQSTKQSITFPTVTKKTSYVIFAIILFYVLTIFGTYQSNFNFFSKTYPNNATFFVNGNKVSNQSYIYVKANNVVDMQFQSRENNLGILVMHIDHVSYKNIKDKSLILMFHIKEVGMKNWYATSSYQLIDIGDDLNHVFGFPVIASSMGKKYLVEFNLSSLSTPEYVRLDTSQKTIRSVYSLNKKQMFTHPISLLNFIFNKIENVASDTSAQLVLYLFLPFAFLSLFLLYTSRKKLIDN